MIQVTHIQIDNFGPFTEGMGSNREHKIQILLSEIFIFLQKSFNLQGGLVFSATKDNMIAITNGIAIEYHQFIINELERNFPVTISMGIGIGEIPLEAQKEASEALILHRSTHSSSKRVLAYKGQNLPIKSDIKVAHLDINDYTKIATNVNPFYSNYINLNRGYLTLMEYFRNIGALCFFNGGDNFISICPIHTKPSEIEHIVESFENIHKPWKLKAGIGVGKNILNAIANANICLKEIRAYNNQKKVMILT